MYCVVPENIHTPPSPTEGIFPVTPPPLWIFQKLAPKTDPPLPSGNSVFVAHPLEILSFLVETKNKKFFLVQDTEFWSLLFFFPKNFVGTVTRRYVAYIKDAYRGICNMQIMDLIP